MTENDKNNLKILDEMFRDCSICGKEINKFIPKWTEKTKYFIIGRTPQDFNNDEKFWSLMNEHGLEKDEFLLISSINCVDYDEINITDDSKKIACNLWMNEYFNTIKLYKGFKIDLFTINEVFETDHIFYDANLSSIKLEYFGITAPVISILPFSFLKDNRYIFDTSIEKFKKILGYYNEYK